MYNFNFTVYYLIFQFNLLHGPIKVFFKYDEDLWGTCTNWTNWGCYRTSSGQKILPSIMSGNVTSHASIKYWRVNWDQEFKKETGFGQVCKNRIITPSGKKKLCNNNLTLLFVISTFLDSYIGCFRGKKLITILGQYLVKFI